MVKNLLANAGDAGDVDLIRGLGRSLEEEADFNGHEFEQTL